MGPCGHAGQRSCRTAVPACSASRAQASMIGYDTSQIRQTPAARPAAGAREPRRHSRRRASKGGGAATQARPLDGPRGHRRPRRSGQLRRIWRPCAAGRVGHDRRRRWRRHGHGADRRPAGRPADLRLHGLCRHAERHQPHEDDAHVRACRTSSPAGGVLARRRRGAAARHEGRGPRRHAHLRGVRAAVGAGPDDRHPARPRLRRPRQPRRHVRRADRHQGFPPWAWPGRRSSKRRWASS